jgi:methylmalonyl-CoA/ethylmalonyl-CoA epimerase
MSADLKTHHVGVLVKDLTKALKSYTDTLGYTIRSERFHDPIQTAFVQFLGIPGDSSLLELIAPDGPGSRLANSLKKGGGINHIGYAVPVIEEAVTAFEKRGMVTIHAPQPAVAFNGRRIAWLMNRDHLLIELVEQGKPGEL